MPIWVILVLAVFLLLAPWAAVRYAHAGAPRNAVQAEVTVKKIKSLSRPELIAMLNRIKTSGAPEPRIGALCYETVTVYDRVEYVCPHCGEKTVYPRGFVGDQLVEVQELEREFAILQKKSPLKIDLEINGYCKHCASGLQPRGAALIVTYDDGSVTRTFPFGLEDVHLLKALFEGKLLFDAGYENEFPLIDKLPRLEEILGVKIARRP